VFWEKGYTGEGGGSRRGKELQRKYEKEENHSPIFRYTLLGKEKIGINRSRSDEKIRDKKGWETKEKIHGTLPESPVGPTTPQGKHPWGN